MKKRNMRVVATCAALAMVSLAACGDDDDEGEGTASPTSGSTSAPSGDRETFTIGVYAPTALAQGRDIVAGAELAAEEINAAGEGPMIEIIECDSEAMPQKAIQCVTKFAQQDGVDAIAGGFTSGETLAAVGTVVQSGIPYVSSGAASPQVVKAEGADAPYPNVFRIGPVNASALAADMCATYAGFFKAQGFTKMGLLTEDVEVFTVLPTFLAGCLPNPSEATGGQIPITDGVEVVGVEKHTSAATDFAAQFTKLEDAGAQFVIVANITDAGIALAQQWATLKPNFAIGGISVAGQTEEYFDATKSVGEVNGPGGVIRAPVSEKTIPFYDAFQEEYGRVPAYNGTATYDAIYTLHEAAVRAGSLEAAALNTEIEATNRIGAQGRLIIGEDHDVDYSPLDPDAGLNLLYYQFGPEGERNIIYPPALAGDNTYVKPDFVTLSAG